MGFDENGKEIARGEFSNHKDSTGCLMDHEAYGDPRWYKVNRSDSDPRKSSCYSITRGYWSWEENLPWHFGKPKRIAEQELGIDRKLYNKCHKDRWQSRKICPYFVPCEPVESCIGNNRCGKGYTGKKCNKCDQGYFRVDGYCMSCPENPFLMVGMVGAAILMASMVMFVIGEMKINVGVISIGIDYFQVLGMFSSQKIPWPRVMMILFDYLSAFSFNLDVAAPECAGGGVPVYVKWFMTQFIPIAILIGLVVYASIKICFLTMQRRKEKEKVEEVKPESAGNEKVVDGQSNTMQSSIDVKIIEQVGIASSMFLSIFYLMYLNMTK